MGDNLKQKMFGALAWSSIDRFGQQAIQLVITFFLARLLTPADYTLIGLVMVFVSLSNTLVDSGFGVALVRKPDANETDFNSVFYFNIFVSILLYIFLFFFANTIAVFFNEPKLVLVSRVIFIGILINALYLIPTVKMVKALDFKSSALVNMFSVACSGIIGICMAIFGYGVWALVAQQILFHFFRLLSLSFIIKWKPQLVFSFRVIKGFWSYSVNILGTAILNTIFNYIYILILGKYYPKKQEVGLYYQANKLNDTLNYSFQVIIGTTYSILVKIQDDVTRFQRVFRELARKSSIITIPIMLSLIVVAKPLIAVFLTSKWLPSVPYFQLLCLASIFNPLYTLSISALNARGKSKVTFRIEIIKKALIALSVVVCFKYGIIALLIGYVVVCWISYILSVIELKKDLTHYWKHQFIDIFPSLGIGLVIAGVLYVFSIFIANQHLLFSIQFLIGLGLYILSIKIFYQDVFNSALTYIHRILKIRWNEKND